MRLHTMTDQQPADYAMHAGLHILSANPGTSSQPTLAHPLSQPWHILSANPGTSVQPDELAKDVTASLSPAKAASSASVDSAVCLLL